MSEKPLAVAIAALIQNGRILLIKRAKGDYIGLWGLPGGKIEKEEHFSRAATREIWEETEIKSDFIEYLGLVSEHLIEDGNVFQHFLLHICRILSQNAVIPKEKREELKWFSLNLIENAKSGIIPSDFLIIKKMILGKEKNYYECIIEKLGSEHRLKKFE